MKENARNVASSMAGSAAGDKVFQWHFNNRFKANQSFNDQHLLKSRNFETQWARRVTNRGFSVFLWRGRHVVIIGNACNGNGAYGLDGDWRKHVSLSLQGSVLLFCFQRPQPFHWPRVLLPVQSNSFATKQASTTKMPTANIPKISSIT